jgi:hypothetical protein
VNKMDNKTIVTRFDPSALPRWAQKDDNVVALCEKSLSFRCDVCAAQTTAMKRLLKRDAARQIARAHNKKEV